MANKSDDIIKSIKYKNIAILLGIVLLIILIIFAACTDSSAKVDENAQKMQTLASSEQQTTEASPSAVFEGSKTLELDNSVDLKTGNLVLANSENEFDQDMTDSVVSLIGYNKNSDSVKLFSLKDGSVSITESAALQLQQMLTDFYAEKQNSTFFISSGYVAKDSQSGLPFDAGMNDAGTGLSITVGVWNDGASAYDGTGDFEWITQNMAKYGFVTRYASDKTDITKADGDASILRYVGLPHAEIMTANNFCLEEYLDYIKSYTFENPLQQTASNNVNYAVYYTEAKKGNTTEIQIPLNADGSECAYSISGNNTDGYIVTVALGINDSTTQEAATTAAEDSATDAADSATEAEAQTSSESVKETVAAQVSITTVTAVVPSTSSEEATTAAADTE